MVGTLPQRVCQVWWSHLFHDHHHYCQSYGFVRTPKDHDSSFKVYIWLKNNKIQSKLKGLWRITSFSALRMATRAGKPWLQESSLLSLSPFKGLLLLINSVDCKSSTNLINCANKTSEPPVLTKPKRETLCTSGPRHVQQGIFGGNSTQDRTLQRRCTPKVKS